MLSGRCAGSTLPTIPVLNMPKPMGDWRLWQYRDDNNCWDFVRTVLHVEFNVPLSAIPRFGICPDDKTAMTSAYQVVKRQFTRVRAPTAGTVVCHFDGDTLLHVGIVRHDGRVWHASSASKGVTNVSVPVFQKIATTRFYQWQG